MTRDLENILSRAAAEKPLLRLRQRYDPFLALWRHPVLLASGLLTPVFMLPELSWVLGALTGLEGRLLTFTALFSCFLAATGFPLVNAYMESRVLLCTFYGDRLNIVSNWLTREKASIPYTSLAAVKISSSWMQRRMGMGDLDFMVATHAGRIVLDPQKAFTLSDVRNPERAKTRIDAILEQFRQIENEKRNGR